VTKQFDSKLEELMRQGRLTKQQLLDAWPDVIHEHYGRHKINSERGLQASLWRRLWPLLPKNRHVLIEPTIRVAGRRNGPLPT